jgi:hypothetical protein
MSKNWQIVTKRERERLVEQKRTLKRERKRAKAAADRGETPPESPFLPSLVAPEPSGGASEQLEPADAEPDAVEPSAAP